MKLNEAVTHRILQCCKEKNISINKLATISLLTQSTLNNIVNNHTKDIKLLTLIRICDGLDMSLSEFFDDDVFFNMTVDI